MSTDYNPFQSPEAVSQPGSGAAWPIIPFQSGHQRAMIAIWLLAILAIMYLAGVAVAWTEYASLVREPDGTYAITGSGVEADQGQRLLSVAEMMIAVGTIIAFSMWTHRASRNLPALGGRGLRYTPAWAVGWFFIPFAHLVMPYFVAAEIWRESDPVQKHLDDQGGKTASPLVLSWWLTYIAEAYLPSVVWVTEVVIIAVNIVSQHGNEVQLKREINQHLPLLFQLMLMGMVLGTIAAVLAISYVYRVDANQQAKFDLSAGGGFAA